MKACGSKVDSHPINRSKYTGNVTMNKNTHSHVEPVDSRTTERIIKEILSWSDEQWDSHKAGLNAEQLQEMQQEIDDLGLLFGKLKSNEYNWRKSALVCLPAQYMGLPNKHFLNTGGLLQESDPELKKFAQYCSHKNLHEVFYPNEGESAPSTQSSTLTYEHAELHGTLVDALYEGFAKVLRSRGQAGRTVLESLFWSLNDGTTLRAKAYKSHDWDNVLRKIGPYAYLLRDPESGLAPDPVGMRVTTFIRQISEVNHINECLPDQVCRNKLNNIDTSIKPAPVANEETAREPSLHALLLHHIGLNRAYLEYSAHYLDISDYASALVEAIEFYETTGIHIENEFIDSQETATAGLPNCDELQLLMHLADHGLRQVFPALSLSKDQCEQIITLAEQTILSDAAAMKMLAFIELRSGEIARVNASAQLLTMCAFCFLWFFVRNEHVSTRVFGRTHASFSLLGRSLNKDFSQLEVSQQNVLKHVVMAVRRSDQWQCINAARMRDYLRARAFNLVTLTAQVAAIKRMDLHGFGRWAQSIQFSDYLAKAIGESMMVDVPNAWIKPV